MIRKGSGPIPNHKVLYIHLACRKPTPIRPIASLIDIRFWLMDTADVRSGDSDELPFGCLGTRSWRIFDIEAQEKK
jgi:hypothetical protein